MNIIIIMKIGFGLAKSIGKHIWGNHKHTIVNNLASQGKKLIKKAPIPGKKILLKGVDHIAKTLKGNNHDISSIRQNGSNQIGTYKKSFGLGPMTSVASLFM